MCCHLIAYTIIRSSLKVSFRTIIGGRGIFVLIVEVQYQSQMSDFVNRKPLAELIVYSLPSRCVAP